MWPFENKTKQKIKKEEIPELPELPPLPELDYKPDIKRLKTGIKDELPPLSSFPTFSAKEKIGNVSAKHEIKEPLKIKVDLPRKSRTRELEENEIREKTGHIPIVKEISSGIKIEPIFVRIDKYQQAMSQFQSIKKRLTEIDNLLRNIKEMRNKEEAELQQWEQEIQEAKSKINNIDKTIFSKLE